MVLSSKVSTVILPKKKFEKRILLAASSQETFLTKVLESKSNCHGKFFKPVALQYLKKCKIYGYERTDGNPN